jgi:hypothetical protein
MRVKATKLGIYGGRRIKPGVEFVIEDESHLGKWMEVLEDEPEPEPKPKKKAKKKTIFASRPKVEVKPEPEKEAEAPDTL